MCHNKLGEEQKSKFEVEIAKQQESADELLVEVNDGERVAPTHRIKVQIKGLGERGRTFFTDDFQKFPLDARVAAKRAKEGEDELLLSEHPQIRAVWDARLKKVNTDAELLLDGVLDGVLRRGRTKVETTELKARWAHAREVTYLAPPDPPGKRRLRWWERLMRAILALNYRVFWKKFARLPKVPRTVHMDQLLSESPGDNGGIRTNLADLDDAIRRCRVLLEEVNQITVPNSAGADQDVL